MSARARAAGAAASNRLPWAGLLMIIVTCAACADMRPEAPKVDSAPTTQALKKLPHKAGERVAVSIYEFRSSLPNVSSQGATDMFKTALVHSGQFMVVERSRLSEGVIKEKQLNQGGLSTGAAAKTQLRGAQYVFEGTLSEANVSETQRSSSFGIGGMQVGGGTNKDTIAIDVRIVDARTGDILDAVTVKKSLKADSTSVSGVGNLLGTILAQQGKSTAYTPDVNVQQQRHEGVDAALREAINQAVIEIAKRFAP